MSNLKQKRFVDTDYLQENVVERLEILENVTEGQNMQYSTDQGYIHCNNTKKGRVNDLTIEGNTMVNYCTDGSKTLTLNGDINEVGTHITTTNAVNNGLVDVVCEGETLVNVCNQKDPIAITKSYTVENTNHVPLQGEYDGKARPVVEGNTLVNLCTKHYSFGGTASPTCTTLDNGYSITSTRLGSFVMTNGTNYTLKDNTTYTLVFDLNTSLFTSSTSRLAVSFFGHINGADSYTQGSVGLEGNYSNGYSRVVCKLTTTTNCTRVVVGSHHNDTPVGSYLNIKNMMLFEGDLTANPPSGYIKGLKSSFEDQLIPTNINGIQTSFSLTSNQSHYANTDILKPNTTYTEVYYITKNTLSPSNEIGKVAVINEMPNESIGKQYVIDAGFTGVVVNTYTTDNNYASYSKSQGIRAYSISTSGVLEGYMFLFEGDYTQNVPTVEEVTNHSGKYKVDYKVTGKNKFDCNNVNYAVTRGTAQIVGNKVTVTSTSTDGGNSFANFYVSNLIDGKSYTMRFAGEGVKDASEPWLQIVDKDNKHYNQYIIDTLTFVANGTMEIRLYASVGTTSGKSVSYWDIQIEEGTTATTYEEYKEYTKTFYLNSPLLEGDTIEDVNGKATHVKRYKQIVLNGSESWVKSQTGGTNYLFYLPTSDKKNTGGLICDSFKLLNSYQVDEEGVYSGIDINLRINTNKLSSVTVEGLQQLLQQNPTTVVYELASPVYEKISEESILTDSYVDGHLDLDTNVTVNKVKFIGWGTSLKYIQASTNYTIQFTSDNNGKLNYIGLNWKASPSYDVVKGINRFNVVVGDTINSTFFELNGIGFNASNISVVATEREFDYFEGLSSVGQDNENGHNIEIKTQKNLANINTSGNTNFDIGHIRKGVTYSLKIKRTSNIRYNLISKPSNRRIKMDINSDFTTFTSIADEILFINAYELVDISDIMLVEGVYTENTMPSYTPYTENKKSIPLNEPLRSLPNGVKDKFVKIGQKWYVERNCGEVVLNGSEVWEDASVDEQKLNGYYRFRTKLLNYEKTDTLPVHHYNNRLLNRILQPHGDFEYVYCQGRTDGGLSIFIQSKNFTNITQFKDWINNNPVTVVYPLDKPTYEELEVDPTLTTYVDCTHISTNSVIPCDMKVKNSGYSTIIKPSTLYTVALETNKSGEVKVNLGGAEKTTTNNILTLTTPSTLVDDSLRISGKGLTSSNVRLLEGDKTNFIPSYFEGLKSSFEEKQGDNHIVEVISNNKNLFDINSWSDLDNCKVDTTLGTVTITGTNNDTYTLTGATGSTTCSLEQRKYLIKVKPNTNYTLSTQVEGSASRINYVQFYDGDYYSLGLVNFGTTTKDKLTFTTPLNCKYIGFRVGVRATNQTLIYSNIQLEQNSTNTSYVENKSNKIQFSTLAPLRSVGDISDKLVYKDNKLMIERNCGTYTFKGTETVNRWGQTSSVGYAVFVIDKVITTPNIYLKNSYQTTEVKSNIFSEGNVAQPYKCVQFYGNWHFCLPITELKENTTYAFKEWLQDNPTTVVYQLAEPYYEEIGEYRNLDSYDEGTTIYANTLIAPKNLSFNLATHMSNIVKDVQDDVSDLKTWRSEVFDSITHKKTFDSGFTTVEDTKEGVIDEVKLEGKTLVNKYLQPTTNSYLAKNKVVFAHHRGYIFTTRHCYDVRGWGRTITVVSTTGKPIYLEWLSDDGNAVRWRGTLSNSFVTETFVLPEECSSISIGGYTKDGWTVENALSANIVILEGDHTQNPPSYFEGLMSAGEDVEEMSVESINENLLDSLKHLESKNSVSYIEGNKLVTGSSSNTYVGFAYKIPNVEVGATYTLNAIGNPRGQMELRTLDSEGNIMPNNTVHTSVNTSKSISIKVPVGAKYLKVNLNSGTSTNTSYTFEDITLVKSSTPKPYTPHKSDKKSLLYYDTETQTWEKPVLREWDSIEKHANGKYYYHQRSGEVVLNGSESWRLNKNTDSILQFLLTFGKINPVVISDRFNYSANNDIDECIWVYDTQVIVININKSKLPTQDVQGFKQWLQANNVTVVYQLAQEKVYEVFNLELNSYDGETNVIVNSGAISPITTVSLTSNLPQVAENLKNRVRQLEAEIYNYKVTQNLRQLRTFYKSDYANFGVATVGNTFVAPTSLEITPYGYDLFELFKEIISEGKDCYDRIELEEYIDFYVMTFIFDFEMAFELFDMIDSQHLDTEIEDEPIEDEENSEIIEDEPIDPDFSVDYEEPTIDEDIDVEMGVIPEDDLIDVEMGVIPNDELIDIEMGVIPNEDIDVEFSVDVEEDQTKDEDLEV